jgi:hypothetical protein
LVEIFWEIIYKKKIATWRCELIFSTASHTLRKFYTNQNLEFLDSKVPTPPTEFPRMLELLKFSNEKQAQTPL